jgi:hypothetical protein
MAAAEAILWSVLSKYVPKDTKILPESLQEFWIRTKPRGKEQKIDFSKVDYKESEITWGGK